MLPIASSISLTPILTCSSPLPPAATNFAYLSGRVERQILDDAFEHGVQSSGADVVDRFVHLGRDARDVLDRFVREL